ncbi:MAG: DNA-processing protein DprA [Oscillospiraceae bacterium]
MSTLNYWLWLATKDGLRRETIYRAVDFFGSPEAVYEADQDAYEALGLHKEEQQALCNKAMARPNSILDTCDRLGIWLMTYQDADYPTRLRNIYDPPCVLYGKGKRIHFDETPAVAIVGTRRCSPYGKKVAATLGFQLAYRGMLVISGLAKGIDTVAMTGALRAGVPVVGVLGCGIDVVYPRENREIYRDVASSGTLLSEYPPGTQPLGPHFPVRNRIMSGLSLGVIVVEGPMRSGSLITARHALEQGRDVFAVPGNIDSPLSLGPNRLLRDGAIPVTHADDVIGEYIQQYPTKLHLSPKTMEDRMPNRGEQRRVLAEGHQSSTKKEVDKWEAKDYIDLNDSVEPFTEQEKAILKALGTQSPTQADELAARTEIPPGQLLSALTVLELRGVVLQTPGKCFQRNGDIRE